ncbi:hypothetical protein HRH25_16265 [Flavisolibacter sp. BT320]|nr:hypothetical protein [Flavisolibacter longurius]
MNRFNLFYRINKGLKVLLYDTSLLLQRTDFTVADEESTVRRQLKTVVSVFDAFRISEERYILPAIIYYEPGIAIQFEEDRRMRQVLLLQVEPLLFANDPNQGAESVLSSGVELMTVFESFSTLTITQMARDERFLNKILWRYYSDTELQAIEWKIFAAKGSVKISKVICHWVLRGLTTKEAKNWLEEARFSASDDELQILLRSARYEHHPSNRNVLHQVPEAGMVV